MWMSCVHNMFTLVFVKIPKGKRLRSQTKENVYDYSKNSTGINGLKVSETTPVI